MQARDVYGEEGGGEEVEAGGEDQKVDGVVGAGGGGEARRGDGGDEVGGEIDQGCVGLVEEVEVRGFEAGAFGAEGVRALDGGEDVGLGGELADFFLSVWMVWCGAP